MTLRGERPVGLLYLKRVTRLLQEARLAEPSGGQWEAADVQWWWKTDQHSDPDGQTATGTESPIVVKNLKPGQEYTFKIRATNASGDGPDSGASRGATPVA